LGHDPPILEGLDRRDALDPERARQRRIGVRVQLGQDDLALALGRLGLQDRAEHPARAAPLGPEVHHHRHLPGALDHLALEVLLRRVDAHRRQGTARRVADFEVVAAGVSRAGEEAGEGPPVVLLHGLTATRRYVVMGSRMLERAGHRVVAYDARGHGRSSPAPDPAAYRYTDLAADLAAVL